MKQPLLSILIPTVKGREKNFAHLKERLTQQSANMPRHSIECKVFMDDKTMSIGEKREKMYKEANGIYSLQIDDDDDIADGGLQKIMDCVNFSVSLMNPKSCITYNEKCMMNGVYKSSSHSLKYSKWQDNFDGFDFVRTPFYKDVILTEIAKKVPFPYIRFNEDEKWSMSLLPHLVDEIHIDEEIYHYIYNETPHNERYGIK